MNKNKKPLVTIDRTVRDTWDLIKYIVPILKKAGMEKEAKKFISKVRTGINLFDALTLAKKIVSLKIM